MSIKGHYNGKVVVLDEPANLQPDQRVLVSPEPPPSDSEFGTMAYLIQHMGPPMGDDDAREMMAAIEETFEQIEPERHADL